VIALRRYCPLHRIDYILVEGKEWVADPDKRYETTIEIREPLLLAIPKLTTLVLNDLPKAFNLEENDIHRKETPLIPRKVIREAIVNAVMHRNYRERSPVQIIRFSDRLEIRNPGYSLKPKDELDQPGSKTRNEKIAAVLHEIGLAETKGSGIRVMLEAMREANLTVPWFDSSRDRDNFCVALFIHHLLDQEDIEWLKQFKDYGLSNDEAKALVLLRKVGNINNLMYRVTNNVDTLTASQYLRRLRDAGLLEQQSKGPATYYTLSPNLDSRTTETQSLSGQSDNPNLDSNIKESQQLTLELFTAIKIESLEERLTNIGERTKPETIKTLILDLCQQKAYSSSELESLLKRNRKYLLENYLKPLIAQRLLEYTNPEKPNDPHQTYRTTQK
jgi:ATP-dependent DNA helicase RecG